MSTAAPMAMPGSVLDLGAPVVMGVLNVTPDSFSDGGRIPSATRRCAMRGG